MHETRAGGSDIPAREADGHELFNCNSRKREQAKLLLRLLLTQGSRDKSTLIVSARICHYDLITNNRPLTFETVYQIPILKVDRRPPLLPPEGNFSLGRKHRMVSVVGLAPHLETRSLVFLAQVETFPVVPNTTEGCGLTTAMEQMGSSQDPCLSWIILGITKKQSIAAWFPRQGTARTRNRAFLGYF